MPEAAVLFREWAGYLKPEDITQLESAYHFSKAAHEGRAAVDAIAGDLDLAAHGIDGDKGTFELPVFGELVEKLGGPSVKPYQPPGIWEEVAMPESNTKTYVPEEFSRE